MLERSQQIEMLIRAKLKKDGKIWSLERISKECGLGMRKLYSSFETDIWTKYVCEKLSKWLGQDIMYLVNSDFRKGCNKDDNNNENAIEE